MFYTRDIRGGLGERDSFRSMLKGNFLCIMQKLLQTILIKSPSMEDGMTFLPSLMGTPAEAQCGCLIRDQINSDIENANQGKPISLLAKWMPSINASSKEKIKLANSIAKTFGLTPAQVS